MHSCGHHGVPGKKQALDSMDQEIDDARKYHKEIPQYAL